MGNILHNFENPKEVYNITSINKITLEILLAHNMPSWDWKVRFPIQRIRRMEDICACLSNTIKQYCKTKIIQKVKHNYTDLHHNYYSMKFIDW